jgi:hypothetical protein
MTKRKKDGKEHRYWSIVENHRISGGRVVQKHVLYLGEINDSQREAWWRSIEILESGKRKPRKVSLFPEDRKVQSNDHDVIHVHVNQMRLERPRQWGACWMALFLWDQLQLDRYWAEKLPPSRQHPMPQYLKNSGLLQADTAGKRMAAASGVVWQ